MESYGVIYKCVNIFNDRVYIGQTINFEKRKKSHLNSNHYSAIKNDLLKYGSDAFIWFIIQECSNQTELSHAEHYWIQIHLDRGMKLGESLYNKNTGGNRGYKISESTKETLRKKMSGDGNPMYGRIHNENTIKILREQKVGSNNPNHGKRGIESSHWNCPHNEKTKQKLRKNNTCSYIVHFEDGNIKKYPDTPFMDVCKSLGIGKDTFDSFYYPRKPYMGITRIEKYGGQILSEPQKSYSNSTSFIVYFNDGTKKEYIEIGYRKMSKVLGTYHRNIKNLCESGKSYQNIKKIEIK